MEVLNSKININQFFEGLEQYSNSILMLDYDGTLAPFNRERMKAFPYDGVVDLLTEINLAGSSRVIIVSGRAVGDFNTLLKQSPGLEIWGSHGMERLDENGTYRFLFDDRGVIGELQNVIKMLIHEGVDERNIEKKPASVAVHWRGIDEHAEEIMERCQRIFSANDCGGKLYARKFDGGVELRPVDRGKSEVIDKILTGCSRSCMIAYLGDDYTDEDAFRALKGRGLSALVREELRETYADIWIKPPEELLDFLGKWKSALAV